MVLVWSKFNCAEDPGSPSWPYTRNKNRIAIISIMHKRKKERGKERKNEIKKGSKNEGKKEWRKEWRKIERKKEWKRMKERKEWWEKGLKKMKEENKQIMK